MKILLATSEVDAQPSDEFLERAQHCLERLGLGEVDGAATREFPSFGPRSSDLEL